MIKINFGDSQQELSADLSSFNLLMTKKHCLFLAGLIIIMHSNVEGMFNTSISYRTQKLVIIEEKILTRFSKMIVRQVQSSNGRVQT